MSTVENVLKAKPKNVNPLSLPDWDLVIYARDLSTAERLKFSKLHKDSEGDDIKQAELLCHLLGWSLVNVNGEKIFTSDDSSLQLLEVSTKLFTDLVAAVLEHNGLTKERVEEAKKA